MPDPVLCMIYPTFISEIMAVAWALLSSSTDDEIDLEVLTFESSSF